MKRILLFSVILSFFVMGCTKPATRELYCPFPDKAWHRFSKLDFELPVTRSDKPVNVYVFARSQKDFPYNTLDFHMIMNTPSGEERIREFHMQMRDSSGNMAGACAGDSCTAEILIGQGVKITQKGILKVNLENIIPRLVTPGLLGVGIRVETP